MHTLSILSCVYNESLCLDAFRARIEPVINELSQKYYVRIVFINNGSTDSSLSQIKAIIDSDNRYRVLTLSRNFGYQGALVAGVSEIDSDIYCVVDVDCEDPPEMVLQFENQIAQGYKIAYGIRSNREEPKYITWMRGQFYKCNKLIADSEIILWMAEFSMFTREVRDNLLKIHTTFPFLRTELAYLGFKKIGLCYRRGPRVGGKSHYNLLSMAQFAIGGIMASTTLPLRIPLYVSPFFILTFIIAACLKPDVDFLGSISAILLFLYCLISIPFISAYLARTYKDVTSRPLYVVDKSETKL